MAPGLQALLVYLLLSWSGLSLLMVTYPPSLGWASLSSFASGMPSSPPAPPPSGGWGGGVSSPDPCLVYFFGPLQRRGQLAGGFPLLSSLRREEGRGLGVCPLQGHCGTWDDGGLEARSSSSCSRMRSAAPPPQLMSYDDREEVGRGCPRGPSMLQAEVLRTWLPPPRPQVLKPL